MTTLIAEPPLLTAPASARLMLGEWLIARNEATPRAIVSALLEQERRTPAPGRMLRDAGLDDERVLMALSEAERHGVHPFTVVGNARWIADHDAQRLFAAQRAARPPLGRLLVEQGVLSGERMRSLLAEFMAQRATSANAPASSAKPAHQPAPANEQEPAPAAAAQPAAMIPANTVTMDADMEQELRSSTDETMRARMDAATLALAELTADTAPSTIDRLYRDLHSLKGSFGFIQAHGAVAIIHHAENLLGVLKRNPRAVPSIDAQPSVDCLLEGLDLLWEVRASILAFRDERPVIHQRSERLAHWQSRIADTAEQVATALAASGGDVTEEF